MANINTDLQSLLNDFGKNNSNASKTFTDALNASPALLGQYNTLAACGYLKGFAKSTLSGVGGAFNPNSQVFSIPLDNNGNITIGMADLVFVMGHEGQHAENYFTTRFAAEQLFGREVNTLASQPGNHDYTPLLHTIQQVNLTDESMAHLSGWNAYVDYSRFKNPKITRDELIQNSKYSASFFENTTNTPKSGLIFNDNLSITATPANIAAEGQIYFFNPNAGLGANRDLTYPNWYGAYNVDLICRATNGNNGEF
ncbi:MAG: hypothetical protein PHY62_09600 [Gallionella sp.]|nr:hypothetical protein [Gallionella sp.]